MGGPFSQITRSYFRVPYTYASSVLSESLAQAHHLLIYLCFFFFIYFSYNFSFLFLIAMECRPRKWRDSSLLAEVSQDEAKIPRRDRPLLAEKRDSGTICFFFLARFSEKLQRNCTSKCYCKKTNRQQFSVCTLIDHRNDVKMFKILQWNHPPADRESTWVYV